MARKSLLKTDPFVVLIILIVAGISYLQINKPALQNAPTTEIVAAKVPDVAPLKLPAVQLVFVEKFFDFGPIVEGEIIKHTFKFKNEGPGPVKIIKTEASCGCTTLSGVIREYAPGETAEMEVTIDTKDKKGIVVKTVTLTLENNDAAKLEISMAMTLSPPPHPRIGNIRNINTEAACKTCHLESGEGQTGTFLYHRICAQCHGKKGIGGFGRALNDAKWQKVSDAHIKKVIHGGLTNKGMPSYVEGVTPPLTEEQISSLVKYIRGLVKP